MKLSKPQIKAHNEAMKLLEKDALSFEDKWFVINNFHPAYNNQVGLIGSFFTPYELAKEFCINLSGGSKIIDLCAGVGMLSFAATRYFQIDEIEITCLERNAEFVEVGKKLVPEANWICADVLDEETIKSLGTFDYAISNPPFGKIKSSTDDQWLRYKGSEFDYKVIEVAGFLAKSGSFILPSMSAPFKYSGENSYSERQSDKYEKFTKETGIVLEIGVAVDYSVYKDYWSLASPNIEVVVVETFPEIKRGSDVTIKAMEISNQLDLFKAS